MEVIVIGAGLAGSEAALQLSKRNIKVKLYEMRPQKTTGAHTGSNCAEFVCSNSLGSSDITNASGLLKHEMKILGGELIKTAFECRVPAGNALAIDRELFSQRVTEQIEKDVNITMCMPDGYDEKNKKETPFPYFVDENFANIPEERIFSWKDLSPFKYPMCVWNKLYKKELFDKNKIEFAEGLDFEDHKVIFGSLLTAEKIYFIKEKLYVYRFNREGSVLTDNNRRLIDHIEIFNIVENILKNTNTYEALREDFLLYKIHNLLYYYSMIKEEFKNEYYENMINSIKETNITEEEMKFLKEKYPELEEIIK